MKKGVLFLISALSLGAIVGCSSGDDSGTVQVLTVSIETPEKTTLIVGETIALKAKVENNPNALSVSWESSDVNIARVDFNGNVTALKKGTVEIYAKCGEAKSSSLTLTIEDKINVSIKTPEKTELTEGDEITLTANVENNVHNLPLVWKSSAEDVASISADGKLVALKEGKTTITLKVGDVTSKGIEFVINKKIIQVTSVTLSAKKAAIGVGEDLIINAEVLPNDATNKNVTLTSSDPTAVLIDGMKVTGRKITKEDEVVTITATSDNGVKGTLDIKVIALSDSILPEVEERLLNSVKVEETKLKSGEISTVVTDSTGKETSKEVIEYNVFSDQKSSVKTTKGNKATEIVNGIDGEGLRKIVQESVTQEDGTVTKEYDEYASKYLPFGETTSYNSITKADALKSVSLADIGDDGVAKSGVGYYVFNSLMKQYGCFDYVDGKNNLEYTAINENSILLKSYSETSDYLEFSIKLDFAESGILKAFEFNLDKYDLDYDTMAKGDLKNKTKVIGTSLEGARESSIGKTINFDELYFTDYTPIVTKSTYNVIDTREFMTGDSAYILTKDTKPDTASSLFDKIKIVSVSDTNVATIKENWRKEQYLEFKAACDDLVVTLESEHNKVKKEVHLVIKEPAVESISVSGLVDVDFTNTTRVLTVSAKPTNAKPNIEVTLLDNTSEATLTKLEGNSNKWEIVAKKAGSYTVKVVESTLGETKAYTKTVNVLEDTDVNIANYIASGTYKIGYGSYKPENLKITQIDNTNKCNIEFNVDTDYLVKGTFEIKNGAITLTLDPSSTTEVENVKLRLYNGTKRQFDRLTLEYEYFYETMRIDLTRTN